LAIIPDPIPPLVNPDYCFPGPFYGGGRDPALAASLEQPSQMSSAAHLEPLSNPGQRQGALRTQLPQDIECAPSEPCADVNAIIPAGSAE
jgi:hypothetical protein